MTDTRTMDEIAAEVYADLAKYEKEISDHNIAIIKSFGRNSLKNFESLMDYADVTGKIEVVSQPSGENQHEKHGVFKEVWVQQWSTGMEGDCYSGFIFARIKDNRWIKIPYSC